MATKIMAAVLTAALLSISATVADARAGLAPVPPGTVAPKPTMICGEPGCKGCPRLPNGPCLPRIPIPHPLPPQPTAGPPGPLHCANHRVGRVCQ